MELRQFAEQILFATSLHEKLLSPGIITDEFPGSAFGVPMAPGRPPELRFKAPRAGKTDFPGLHHLEREHERGRLLHFFANHELLAVELMALVLLRFPDAPPAFRRGVLQTLREEQMHTRLYLERMRQCGIQFGESPVSGYFWRCVSSMANPMDYVSRLSLTFEQANLDFCRSYAQSFKAVGDSDTARLLNRIYQDEIGHVAYGLKWFRRWKNPQKTDWEAFCQQLQFPLSPQRAKGFVLNVEGRRAAGFDEEFIDHLSVYSQSRGRTPGIFIFNPLAEGNIAYGKAFTPKKHQLLLAGDLQNLPQFLCRQDDIVLVEKKPSVEFLEDVKRAGFALPEFVELPGLNASTHSRAQTRISLATALADRKLGRLRPWAWGPDSKSLLDPFFTKTSGEKRSPQECFNPAIAQLYSKAWSAALLRRVLKTVKDCADVVSETSTWGRPVQGAEENWLCEETEVGLPVNTFEAALQAIEGIRQRGHLKIVAKQSFGLAGQNSLRLWEPELLESQRRWMYELLQSGQELMIEPWLDRQVDFSVQLEMEPTGLNLRGFTGLVNDHRGQFQANWASPNFRRHLPALVPGLFAQPGISVRLNALYQQIVEQLEPELRQAGYFGPIGIDAFVYQGPGDVCRLKPIVEINPRYTMGRLTLELMRQACPGTYGLLHLASRAQLRREGFENPAAYACWLREHFPLRLKGDPRPRIRSGALWLNDPTQANVRLAVFRVTDNAEEMFEWLRDLNAAQFDSVQVPRAQKSKLMW
jgi:uncharacterized ferritin-like protein (DUF455 family)